LANTRKPDAAYVGRMGHNVASADIGTVEVSDDFGEDLAIGIEELEAVEAFLTQFLGDMLTRQKPEAVQEDSERSQNPALV
jgi:hypothetical protein